MMFLPRQRSSDSDADPLQNFSERSVFLVAKQVAAGLVSPIIFVMLLFSPHDAMEKKRVCESAVNEHFNQRFTGL